MVPGPVIVESDSARIIKAMTSQSADRSEIRGTIMEAKEYLQLLVDWKFQKVKREGNKVAQELAHLARRDTYTATWLGQAPLCFQDLINFDCNSLFI